MTRSKIWTKRCIHDDAIIFIRNSTIPFIVEMGWSKFIKIEYIMHDQFCLNKHLVAYDCKYPIIMYLNPVPKMENYHFKNSIQVSNKFF